MAPRLSSRLVPLMLVVIVLTVAVATLAGNELKLIPITTSSEAALKDFLIGRDLNEKLRFQESREYFERAVAEDPQFALAYLNLAFVQPSTKEFFKYLDKAVSLAEGVSDGEKLMIMANLAASSGESGKQKKYLEKLVALYPGDERAHNQMGTYYFGIQDYPSAIGAYEAATRINPNFSQPYNQLGYAYRFLGDFEQAEKAFQKYIELIPDDPNPHDSYAELLMKMGQFEKSIEHYRRALEINPGFTASYIGIATDYCLMKKYQEARSELQNIHEIAIDDGQRRAAFFAEAVSYADEGEFQNAIGSVRKQYALAEKIADAASMAADLVTTGNIQLEAGDYDGALENFKEAVKVVEGSDLAPEVIENGRRAFLFNSGRAEIMKGDIEAAKQKAEKHLLLTTELNNPFQIRLSHQLAGMIALAEQNYEMAVKELMQANLQDPYNHFRLAQAYYGLGDNEKAKVACEKAAHYNSLNNINYAFIRDKAEKFLASM